MAKSLTSQGIAEVPEETQAPEDDLAQLILTKPIHHGDEEIKVLHFREPTANDVCEVGYLFSMDTDGDIVTKPKRVLAWAVRLAGLPPSVIKQMAVSDFEKLLWRLMAFFNQSLEPDTVNQND